MESPRHIQKEGRTVFTRQYQPGMWLTCCLDGEYILCPSEFDPIAVVATSTFDPIRSIELVGEELVDYDCSAGVMVTSSRSRVPRGCNEGVRIIRLVTM